jgi:hypothetical protein
MNAQINKLPILVLWKFLSPLFHISFEAISHHKLESEKSTIGTRGTFEYLDVVLGVDCEGIHQLFQRLLLSKSLGNIIACILDKSSLFFRRRASTTLLDSIVIDRALAGELSGSLSKESEGMLADSTNNKQKHMR